MKGNWPMKQVCENEFFFFNKVSGITNSIKKMQELQDMVFEITKNLWPTIQTI